MRKKQRFAGWHLVTDELTGDPYMFRAWIGRLRLHIFYRGDHDPDPHDHPWEFWTFPLTPYVEEVVYNDPELSGYQRRRQVVPAFRLTHRPAEYCHRVLGRYSGNVLDDFGFMHKVSAKQAEMLPSSKFEPYYDIDDPLSGPPRKIVTIVWRGKIGRDWGFLKHRDGRWCWIHFKEYIWGGGKSAPCDD